jgi:hypothetical protein
MATMRRKKNSKTIAEHSNRERLVNDELNQDRHVWYRYELIRKRPALKRLRPARPPAT